MYSSCCRTVVLRWCAACPPLPTVGIRCARLPALAQLPGGGGAKALSVASSCRAPLPRATCHRAMHSGRRHRQSAGGGHAGSLGLLQHQPRQRAAVTPFAIRRSSQDCVVCLHPLQQRRYPRACCCLAAASRWRAAAAAAAICGTVSGATAAQRSAARAPALDAMSIGVRADWATRARGRGAMDARQRARPNHTTRSAPSDATHARRLWPPCLRRAPPARARTPRAHTTPPCAAACCPAAAHTERQSVSMMRDAVRVHACVS